MLRALIVDDERLARVALRGLLEERGDVEIVGEADGVAAARLRLAELKPDVVFLDVQMPGGSGFELFGEGLHAPFDGVRSGVGLGLERPGHQLFKFG